MMEVGASGFVISRVGCPLLLMERLSNGSSLVYIIPSS